MKYRISIGWLMYISFHELSNFKNPHENKLKFSLKIVLLITVIIALHYKNAN